MSTHRAVTVAHPDAPPGTCRYCGEPTARGLRSHRHCRLEHRDLRDYRAATLRDNGEQCATCGTTRGPFHADHVRPLIDGGSKRAHNRQVLCERCHHRKTAREASARAAARRSGARMTTAAIGAPAPTPTGLREVTGVAVIAVGAGWLTPYRVEAAIAAAGLVVAVLVAYGLRLHLHRRGQAAARLAEALAKETGTSVTAPGLLRVQRWRGLTPVSFVFGYGPGFDDEDAGQCARVERVACRKTGLDLVADWHPARDAVVFRERTEHDVEEPAAEVAEEPKADAHEERLKQALAGYVRSGECRLRIDDRDERGPSRLTITYPTTFRDDSSDVRFGLQEVVNAKMPGRWRMEWDTGRDRVVAVRRPDMPAKIDHPVDLAPDPWRLPFATGEDGAPVYWDMRVAPHLLIAGGTGSGKTVAIRGLVIEAARAGFEVRILDPKRIEMMGLRGWPGVAEVATSTEDMIDLMERMADTMDTRYLLIEQDRQPEGQRPILLVVDEAREWLDRSNEQWKAVDKKERGGQGTEHSVVAQWRSIARLGRSARVHLLVGIQRPDAAVFGGEARDNYGARLALGALSPQGAQMMFQDTAVGRDVPEVKGRATADMGGGPVEVQVWRTPDPGERGIPEADLDLLDALKP